LETDVNGGVGCKLELVRFAVELLDSSITIELLGTVRLVVEFIELLAVFSKVVLSVGVAGAVITATGEGVTRVKISEVEIQPAELVLQA